MLCTLRFTRSKVNLRYTHIRGTFINIPKNNLPLIKSTAISNPYVSLSQSSRMCAPSVIFGSSGLGRSLSLSSVNSIASRACIPPWGITGPQVMVSSRSCTIIRPPRIKSPSTTASFFTGQGNSIFMDTPELEFVIDSLSGVSKSSGELSVVNRGLSDPSVVASFCGVAGDGVVRKGRKESSIRALKSPIVFELFAFSYFTIPNIFEALFGRVIFLVEDCATVWMLPLEVRSCFSFHIPLGVGRRSLWVVTTVFLR